MRNARTTQQSEGFVMKNKSNAVPGKVASAARTYGPLLAIALVVPGGSLVALGLWLYQRRHNASD